MAIDVGFKTETEFEPLKVTRGDLILGSIVFGFFFGFAINVAWSAIRETRRARRFSAYIFMIWLEIAADLGFAITAWGYLSGHFPPGIGVFLMVIICWICQVQCLMLIIVNRLCILYSEPRQRLILKATVAGIVGCISIATGCIWIPAQLQISHRYIWLNHWWDRVEKSIYLLLDLSLNILFIRMVKTRLVKHGLKKYDKVMRFNEYIIIVSIGMDILLLGTTFLRNTFVYCQFHPVVYIVKLQIEMTMSRLLIKVARSTGINVYNEEKGGITSDSLSGNKTTNHGGVAVQIQTQVFTHAEGPDEYELDRRDVKDQTLQLQEAESVNSSGEIIKVSPV
ncbi:uncharacterized protein ARMOST_01121 [Armillaria ostoyae]|uniref:Integral membrane protein n=2 Tax=Armillaria TaxID=47424 RepID=A0A284QN24_ARMOS|nr:hypothetical protein ARMSODRAFT_951752 [Armillaria solidipes]SJK97866.1 uncharacterized protein ARMOST_01121 [Armillaria ostoyae]